MTLTIPSQGVRKTFLKKLADTNSNTIFTVDGSGGKLVYTLESLQISCGSTASEVTLNVNDGTTDFAALNSYAISAKGVYYSPDNFHPVFINGYSLRATANNANQITIVANVIVSSSQNAG